MPKVKWDDRMYVKAYRAARLGMSNHQISKAIGVTPSTVQRWVEENPVFAEAIQEGRKGEAGIGSFRHFYQARLSPSCREYWEGLNAEDFKQRAKVKKKLGDAGTRLRQHVYLFALVECDLAASKARAIADVEKHEVEAWLTDRTFARLAEEIHECKKDFIEGAALDLVAMRVPEAVLQMNRAINRDRGYGERIVVERGGVEAKQARQLALKRLSPDELGTLNRLLSKLRGDKEKPDVKLLGVKQGSKIPVMAVESTADLVDDGEEE